MDPMLGMGPSPPIGAVLSSPVFSPETPAGAAFSLPDFVSSDVEEEADVKVGAEGAASGGVEESLLVAVDGSGVLKPSKTNRLASRRRARALTRVSWHISEPGGPASRIRLLMEGRSVICFIASGFLMKAKAEFRSSSFASLSR